MMEHYREKVLSPEGPFTLKSRIVSPVDVPMKAGLR